jgi:hypothetical protein
MRTRYLIGILFLLLQVFSIFYALFIPERFFCWSPYDEHTYYKIEVIIGIQSLTKKQIKERYKYKAVGWEPRAISNVFNLITQYESSYGKNDKATVSISYSTNGHKSRVWTFIK